MISKRDSSDFQSFYLYFAPEINISITSTTRSGSTTRRNGSTIETGMMMMTMMMMMMIETEIETEIKTNIR